MLQLTEDISTGAFDESIQHFDENIILDVRNLVDGVGNLEEEVNTKLEEGLKILKERGKVLICCDYGMSRSNSIAVGVISSHLNIPFFEAAELVRSKIDEDGLKIGILQSVYNLFKEKVSNDSNRSKIWITGGFGFIGNNLIKNLGRDEVIVTRSSEIDLLENPIKADLFIKKHEIGTIIHLANPKIFTSNQSMGITLHMLKNVLDLCVANDAYLVFPSGWEIYSGYASSSLRADENLPAKPGGTYGESKLFSEILIRNYADSYGLKYMMIRSSPLYGKSSAKPKFIYNFIERARSNATINTHQYINGYPALDLLNIKDYISAFTKLIHMRYTGEINVGSGSLTETNRIAEIIRDTLNSKSDIIHTRIDSFCSNILMDNSKIGSIIGWTPKIDIEMGIRQLIFEYEARE